MSLTYVSVCSGIEAVSVAWQPLGLEPIHFAEIDPFCSTLLNHHYPEVPNLGDITQHETWPEFDNRTRPAVLVGGTPCQSFSVAGLRGGMADPRGQLTLSYLQIAQRYRPRWVVWENVPGVLSSDGGRALGAFLRGLGLLGYGFAYRVLDAQYFGLAQRRKRVFVVGYLGDWRRAAAVLFERESLSWHPPPSREAGQTAAPTLGAGPTSGGQTYGTDADSTFSLQIAGALGTEVPGSRMRCDASDNLLITTPALSLCLNAGVLGRIDAESETLIPTGGFFDDPNDRIEATLRANGGAVPAPLAFSAKDCGSDAGDLAPTLRSGNHDKSHANCGVMPAIQNAQGVRRLMPLECERLQGFPDNYTLVPYRNKPATDGPRYKSLGNSMAVPVLVWIGRRIQMVDTL